MKAIFRMHAGPLEAVATSFALKAPVTIKEGTPGHTIVTGRPSAVMAFIGFLADMEEFCLETVEKEARELADDAIAMARKYCPADQSRWAPMSAHLYVADAEFLYSRGNFDGATGRAIKSLVYSVGIFHPDYLLIAREG